MRLLALVVASFMAVAVNAAAACDLPPPQAAANLVLIGQIARCSTEGKASFDSDLFDKLPRHKVRTTNPWEKGEVEYEGVLLSDLLAYVGASGSKILVSALNDYSYEIPIADVMKYGILLADKREGVAMPVHDKGPYFVVLPFDQFPELRSEDRYAQSVWQVSQIAVEP